MVDELGGEASAQDTVHVQADAEHNSAPLPRPVETRAFGGERSVVGRSVDINGRSAEIVGVMPPWFGYPSADKISLA